MLKAFCDALRDAFAQGIRTADPAFQIRPKKLGRPYAGSVVLEKPIGNGFMGFVHLQFVQGRNYVIPSVQWSSTSQYPDEAECRLRQEGLAARGVSIRQMRETLPAGWSDATDFGTFSNHFALDASPPPRELIRAAYEQPTARRLIESDPFLKGASWEGNPDFDSWEAMAAMAGVEPTQDQAICVTRELSQQVNSIAVESFLPFLHGR